jgi:hypothetical protein
MLFEMQALAKVGKKLLSRRRLGISAIDGASTFCAFQRAVITSRQSCLDCASVARQGVCKTLFSKQRNQGPKRAFLRLK